MRKHKPKISVVMSAYNAEKYIAEAIESILNQTFEDFELIIINDTSADNTLKIIKSYMGKDKRIILINNNKNIGQTKSRNTALNIARGDYIAIIDSDDLSLPERFEIQYDYLKKNKDIFLVGGGTINIDINGNKTSRFKPITNGNKLKKKLKEGNAISHPTIMFRNKGNLFYREKFKYSEDYDFYLLLLSKNKKLMNIKDFLLKYRRLPTSIGISKSCKERLFAIKAKEFYHQRIKYGKDEYEFFDSNEILNIDIEKTTNKIVLKQEIFASFKLNNFKRTRKFCKKYFKSYGIFNKLLIYYFASFLGKNIVNFLRKLW